MDQIRDFIDMVASDRMNDAKNVMDEVLSSQAFSAMEEIKQGIAASLFSTVAEGRADDAFAELDSEV